MTKTVLKTRQNRLVSFNTRRINKNETFVYLRLSTLSKYQVAPILFPEHGTGSAEKSSRIAPLESFCSNTAFASADRVIYCFVIQLG